MTGIGVGDGFGMAVGEYEKSRDIILVQNRLQLAIEHVHQDCRTRHGCGKCMETHLEHGRDQCCGHTMTRNICNNEPVCPPPRFTTS
jgi:hypothetical protein